MDRNLSKTNKEDGDVEGNLLARIAAFELPTCPIGVGVGVPANCRT